MWSVYVCVYILKKKSILFKEKNLILTFLFFNHLTPTLL